MDGAKDSTRREAKTGQHAFINHLWLPVLDLNAMTDVVLKAEPVRCLTKHDTLLTREMSLSMGR